MFKIIAVWRLIREVNHSVKKLVSNKWPLFKDEGNKCCTVHFSLKIWVKWVVPDIVQKNSVLWLKSWLERGKHIKTGLSSLTHWAWDTRISTCSHAHTPHLVFLTQRTFQDNAHQVAPLLEESSEFPIEFRRPCHAPANKIKKYSYRTANQKLGCCCFRLNYAILRNMDARAHGV